MNSLGIDYVRLRRESARLVILKALAEQMNGSLDSSMLEQILPVFAIRETRTWIHEQMEYLAEREAVTLTRAGTVMIATLAKRGRRHLERDIAIEGVKRPSEPGE
ncbi:VpaChn25_0724 family phage protein [Brucella pseudogrignonensis]|uniref:VpaChn25_0724 family phage protein n=1 Tax=Brucella pseudogrignonensis TaxID=419475 RepID=UPI003D997A12